MYIYTHMCIYTHIMYMCIYIIHVRVYAHNSIASGIIVHQLTLHNIMPNAVAEGRAAMRRIGDFLALDEAPQC